VDEQEISACRLIRHRYNQHHRPLHFTLLINAAFPTEKLRMLEVLGALALAIALAFSTTAPGDPPPQGGGGSGGGVQINSTDPPPSGGGG
jgi:hypothetical protein